MRILEIGFYLLLNAFRVYIMYRFSGLFFERDRQKKWLIHSYIVFYVINSVEHLAWNIDIVNLVVNIGGLLLVIICGYEGSFKRKLLTVIASYGMNLLTENTAWVVFVKGRNEQMVEFGFFFSVFIFFLLEMFIEKIFRFHKGIDIPLYKDLLLILISAGSMFISSVLIEGFYHSSALLIISLCILLAINLAVFYLYEKILDDHLKQKDKEIYKQQLVMYRNQLRIMQSANDAYATMRHELKHHMLLVTNYLAKKESDRALHYLEKINRFAGNREEYIETGNESIDSIFNYVIDQVNKAGGIIKTDIKVAEEMLIDDFDLNVILSNLLINAWEAISKCDKKLIQAIMRYDRGVLTLKISNTYNGMIRKRREAFLSTKPKSSEHGIGIMNVEKTVEKYNGKVEINYTDEEFVVKVLIYI